MKTKQQITAELEWLRSLSTVISAYEELAAKRMREIRSAVLHNRDYMQDLQTLYSHVKDSYKKDIQKLLQSKDGQSVDTSPFAKNGKTIRVFVSANTGLYGGLVQQTFQLFASDVRKGNADVAILGKVGRMLWQQARLPKGYVYFDYPDTALSLPSLQPIVVLLSSYQQVFVYHGLYKTIVTQQAAVQNVTGDILPSSYPYRSEQQPIKWLFEPTLEHILEFFEKEIFSSLFVQAMHESHLAKHAARMVALDQATEHIKTSLIKTNVLKNQLTHRLYNKKQLAVLAGRGLWRIR